MAHIDAVNHAIAWFQANIPDTTLSRTTFGALAYTTANGRNVCLAGQAGASSTGLSSTQATNLQNHFSNGPSIDIRSYIVVPCAAPVGPVGTQGNWHMNDAEQQLLATAHAMIEGGSAAAPRNMASLGAIGATRPFCASCQELIARRYFANQNNSSAWA